MNAFGNDCNDILLYLGFSNEVVQEGDSEEEYWFLPKPPKSDTVLEGNWERTLIEDVRVELLIIISHRKEEEKRTLRNFVYTPQPAVGELEKLLRCTEYEKTAAARRATTSITNNSREHPAYSVLGALGNFSDSLTIYAYRRQASVDPRDTPLFYECLTAIMKDRNSEALQAELATLASLGHVNRQEMEAAYKYFDIDPEHHYHISDQVIMGRFEARLQSSAHWQANEIRQRLMELGAARGSETLRQVAARSQCYCSACLLWTH